MLTSIFRTLFASFVSNTKERDLNEEEFFISEEDQYRDHFLDQAFKGDYEGAREAYDQYCTIRDFDRDNPDHAGLF